MAAAVRRPYSESWPWKVVDDMDAVLQIEVVDSEEDAERLDELAQNLREELLQLDVGDVRPATAGDAPPGSKGLELAAVGALLMNFSGPAEVVTKVISAIRSWMRRAPAPGRTLKVSVDGNTLELTNASDAQQQRLVDEFVKVIAEREQA
jgi:hypothetical protein